MPLANTRTLNRRPTHPGEMLREDFFLTTSSPSPDWLQPLASPASRSTNSSRDRRAVSPEMALRLGRLFGNSPEFWMNAQRAVDLFDATQRLGSDVGRITPRCVA